MVFLGVPLGWVAAAFVASAAFSWWIASDTNRAATWNLRNITTFGAIISGASLLVLALETRAEYAKSSAERLVGTYVAGGDFISHSAKWNRQYACETVFVKSEFSPSDFDAQVSDQGRVCNWFSRIDDKIAPLDFGSLPDIEGFIPEIPKLETTGWLNEIERFLVEVQTHKLAVDEIRDLNATANSSFLGALKILLPLTLSIGLGIQVGSTRAT